MHRYDPEFTHRVTDEEGGTYFAGTLDECNNYLATLPRHKIISNVEGRVIAFTLAEILDLIVAIEDGSRDVLPGEFATKIGTLTDVEISDFANTFINEEGRKQGYTEDDRDEAIRVLCEWRARYGVGS